MRRSGLLITATRTYERNSTFDIGVSEAGCPKRSFRSRQEALLFTRSHRTTAPDCYSCFEGKDFGPYRCPTEGVRHYHNGHRWPSSEGEL
jgi:hypothetical protein